jgi:thioredoxin reductase (NADPH)
MSMFDYDARPVTPGVVLVGTPASRGGYAIRDFLSRNGYPFEWVDAGQPDAVRAVLGIAEVEPSALPLCILPDGSRLAPATVEQVAAGLGMVAAPSLPEYDLAIVGAGPAGLAAAVNAASEGPRTVVVEAVAPGGQAGTTSMIENYLGFPNGISGSELATRATVQARRFGAELLLARPLVDVSADGPGYATTPPRPLKPSPSPTTSNDPAATSRSGCGCTGWTGKCNAARCAPWPRHPTMSSAACTR